MRRLYQLRVTSRNIRYQQITSALPLIRYLVATS
jgi:hypothetical protein